MRLFKSIKVKEVKKETADTVSISFGVDRKEFEYKSGQYITIQTTLKGEDVRRSYSICSAPHEADFRVAVKKIDNGKMSSFLNNDLRSGDELNLMLPNGHFVIDNLMGDHVGFAAGSGITPVLSMIKSVLNVGGNFTLFYGNKTVDATIFKVEIDQFLKKYPSQFKVTYIYSRESSPVGINEGRLNKEKMIQLLIDQPKILQADGFYVCGPEGMINDVEHTLIENGVRVDKIHFELFSTPVLENEHNHPVDYDFSGTSQVTVLMDGDEFEFSLDSDGESILDSSIKNGVDAPFSCKGAVCCTCKAKLVEGKAIMKLNYALTEEEVAQGYILTCQAHPASETLVVDYDVV